LEFFERQTHINFLGLRKEAALLSLSLCLLSLIILLTHGLNWGLDFTGGTQLQLFFEKEANIPAIRQQLKQGGFSEAVVQSYGSSHDVLLNLARDYRIHNNK